MIVSFPATCLLSKCLSEFSTLRLMAVMRHKIEERCPFRRPYRSPGSPWLSERWRRLARARHHREYLNHRLMWYERLVQQTNFYSLGYMSISDFRFKDWSWRHMVLQNEKNYCRQMSLCLRKGPLRGTVQLGGAAMSEFVHSMHALGIGKTPLAVCSS